MKEVCEEKDIVVFTDRNSDYKSKFRCKFGKNDRHNLFLKLEREERKEGNK